MNKKILIAGIAAIFLLLLIPSVSATWCNNDYGKKAPILINNTGGSAQTYYQVELNYTYDSDMNANFSDVRVYNESDCSLIPLWNESAVASSWNKIWFNATNFPASSWTNDTYYLYYDYSSASSVSNITSTFLFGDDFEGTTINETYLTSWTKSGNNPLQNKTCQNWFMAVYSNYNNEDKIYIFEQRDAATNNTIEAWSFTRANASAPTNWTDHGVVYTATEVHEAGHAEPHGIIFETQSMADAREGVGEGEGTRKWRLYYCAKEVGVGNTNKYTENFAYASESNLTNWTAYSGNPVYDHDATWGFADTKVCIYNNKVWINQSYELVVNQSSWVSWDGAEESTPFYNVTNTGNVNLDVRMQLNTTIANVVLKADTDNNPTGAKEVNTSLVTIYSGLAQGNSVDIWMWSDFSHATEQTTNKTLSINVSQ